MKKLGDNAHYCQSPTPTVNSCDLTPLQHKLKNKNTVTWWHFGHLGLHRCLSTLQMQRRISVVLMLSLVCYCLCWNRIYHLMVQTLGYSYCHSSTSTNQVISVHIPKQQMKLQLLRIAANPILHPLCVLGSFGTRVVNCM